MIPLCDPKQQYGLLKDEIDAAMQEVAAGGRYILGPHVRAFEQEIADYCGVSHAIGVNSGTDALHLALRAQSIGEGDEVITTPFTFIGTTEAICMAGAKPTFVDIDPHTYNIDASQIEQAITPQTRAILPVHLYGQPCDMDRIVGIADKYGLDIIEDCAQAIGASHRGQKVGTFGKAGCFSFFPSKNLGCFGDGGMVVTDDPQLYERVEMLRRHGGKLKYHHTEIGLNSRLDELQAAILRIKLRHLAEWNHARRRCAYQYTELLKGMAGVTCPKEITTGESTVPASAAFENDMVESVYHQFTVTVEDRAVVQTALNAAEIGNAIYYPVPLHLQEVHRDLQLPASSFPHAEHVSERCLSLPMFPELKAVQLEYVVSKLREATCTEEPFRLHKRAS